MDRLWTPWRYAYVTKADGGQKRLGVPEALSAWPGDHHCVFCNIIASVDYAIAQGTPVAEVEGAAWILERSSTCFIILNAFPYNSGHLMVVPYEHQDSLAALPIETANELMLLARRAETALRAVYKPDGINMGLNLGESAGAGVAQHLHLHAVPRWTGDSSFMSVISETRVLPEMLQESWKRLRETLAKTAAE
jgi:ATP adenylyltransferase